MEKQYIIECRYETWTSEGKKFIDWFVYNSSPVTEDEAKTIIKKTKDNFVFIDQKTKLKHEYRLKEYNEYINETKIRKKELEKLAKHQEEYFKSNEYKELQKKKRQSAKERKEHQKKYLEEHLNN